MFNIIFFASGKGSNIAAILEYFKDTNLINPILAISNKKDSGSLSIASDYNIPSLVIDRDYFSSDDFLEILKNKQPDLIVLAGFLWKIPHSIVQSFPGKIINIHPSLLPKYGGKGMYGMNVHQAVIEAGESQSGITIHYVNEQYDKGNIILQAHCPVSTGDSTASLAKKISQLEHFYFPRTIEYLLNYRYSS